MVYDDQKNSMNIILIIKDIFEKFYSTNETKISSNALDIEPCYRLLHLINDQNSDFILNLTHFISFIYANCFLNKDFILNNEILLTDLAETIINMTSKMRILHTTLPEIKETLPTSFKEQLKINLNTKTLYMNGGILITLIRFCIKLLMNIKLVSLKMKILECISMIIEPQSFDYNPKKANSLLEKITQSNTEFKKVLKNLDPYVIYENKDINYPAYIYNLLFNKLGSFILKESQNQDKNNNIIPFDRITTSERFDLSYIDTNFTIEELEVIQKAVYLISTIINYNGNYIRMTLENLNNIVYGSVSTQKSISPELKKSNPQMLANTIPPPKEKENILDDLETLLITYFDYNKRRKSNSNEIQKILSSPYPNSLSKISLEKFEGLIEICISLGKIVHRTNSVIENKELQGQETLINTKIEKIYQYLTFNKIIFESLIKTLERESLKSCLLVINLDINQF